jgi:hypothetical protein
MGLREYIKENENVKKLVELKNKLRDQNVSFNTAKSNRNANSIEFWAHAIINTKEEIKRLETAITKPKRIDSKKTSAEIEIKHNTMDTEGNKEVHITHNGETKVFDKKKDAIHHLLDKGLSAAEITRRGFAGLTVQGAKKSWKQSAVSNQTNDFKKAEEKKFQDEFGNKTYKPLKVKYWRDPTQGISEISLTDLADDVNELLKTTKPETQKFFGTVIPRWDHDDGTLKFASDRGSIKIAPIEKLLMIGYNSNGASNGTQNYVRVPLSSADEKLETKEVMMKLKKELDKFADTVQQKSHREAQAFKAYLNRTGDYYG